LAGYCRRPDISAESLKADVDTSVDMLEILLKCKWEEEEVPSEWTEEQVYWMCAITTEEFLCWSQLARYLTESTIKTEGNIRL